MLSIRAWKTLLSLSFFVIPTLGARDVEAPQQWLGSVCKPKYTELNNESQKLTNDLQLDVGKLSAAWIDGGHEGCGERLLGVHDNSTLTFGRTHDPADTNPYFISLISTETSGFTVSMQSSIASGGLVKVWWEVTAKLERSDDSYYSVSGTLKNDTYLDKNSFSGSSVDTDTNRCGGTKRSFTWKPEANTSTFSGSISASEAVFSIMGTLTDEHTKRLISYVIQFDGEWDSRSAELSLNKPTPSWPNPGNPDAAGEPQVSSILIDTDPIPTVDSSDVAYDSGKDTDDSTKGIGENIGVGGIVGITIAAIFVLGFIIIAAFYAILRRKRQQNKNLNPKIAYIYTSSPGPPVDPPGERPEIPAHYNPNFEMREVLVSDYSLPVTNQHQWREL